MSCIMPFERLSTWCELHSLKKRRGVLFQIISPKCQWPLLPHNVIIQRILSYPPCNSFPQSSAYKVLQIQSVPSSPFQLSFRSMHTCHKCYLFKSKIVTNILWLKSTAFNLQFLPFNFHEDTQPLATFAHSLSVLATC